MFERLIHTLIPAVILTFLPLQVGLGYSIDSLQLRYETYARWCSPEKLFLHIDRTYYAAGETIWFRGYLKNASSVSDVPLSNFIYVELLDEGGSVRSRVKIKRDGKAFPGSLFVRDDLNSGDYTIRAYTLWQLNHSMEYIFTQKIKIRGVGGKKTVPPAAADSIDVTFYPEGGRYFDGHLSRIAFKVMDNHGRSVETSGTIIDDLGSELLPAVTLHDGMGVMTIIPQEGRRYFYRDRSGRTFPFPATSTEGGMTGITATKDNYVVRVFSKSPGECTLLARDDDRIIPLTTVPPDGKAHSYALDRHKFFNAGLNHIILLDAEGRILSERLFYVADTLPKCTVKTAPPTSKRGLVRAHLKLEGQDGTPLDGDLSLSVVKGVFSKYLQDDNLLSYMGLSGELKGRVNNPAWYFDENIPVKERETCLDILLMVQGWRYYDIDKICNLHGNMFTIKHMREYTQSLKGTISRPFGKKMPQNYIFSVIVPKLHFNRFVSVEKADCFQLDSIDFQENTPFLISTNRNGFGGDYIPKWSGDVFAPQFIHPVASGHAPYAGAAIDDKEPFFLETASVDTLTAAVVTADRSDIFDGNINGRNVDENDFKAYAHYTLVEYLVMKNPALEYNGEEMYNRRFRGTGAASFSLDEGEDGVLSMTADLDSGNGRGIVKLVENNSAIEWWTYEQTYMEDVLALSVSTTPDSFYNAEGGVVMIKVQSGAHSARQKNESLLYFVPLGYQKPTKFYSPRYDYGDPYDEMDMRNTLYWDPALEVSNGVADIEFSSTSLLDLPYIITVQGYTSDGRPVSYQTTIQ